MRCKWDTTGGKIKDMSVTYSSTKQSRLSERDMHAMADIEYDPIVNELEGDLACRFGGMARVWSRTRMMRFEKLERVVSSPPDWSLAEVTRTMAFNARVERDYVVMILGDKDEDPKHSRCVVSSELADRLQALLDAGG